MGDPFRRWDNPPALNQHSSPLGSSTALSRPSGKTIYNQRKMYSQTLLKPQSDFQEHVEHLLTVPLGSNIQSPKECPELLKLLEAQGRVWGQNLILQVKDEELVLRDVESKEELDTYPLGSVQGCWAILDACSYDSVLAISVQERSPPRTSILLFQCRHLGAEMLKSSLEKLLKQWKEEQRSQSRSRSPEKSPEVPRRDLHVPPQREPPHLDYGSLDTQQMPPSSPPGRGITEVDQDVEILNKLLGDLEQFLARLESSLAGIAKRRKKKRALPPEDDYRAFFQKVKHALNLLGKTHKRVTEPDPMELLRLIFKSISFVLQHCPQPNLAPAVRDPPLLPEALELLERSLSRDDYGTWRSLGTAWTQSGAGRFTGEQVPSCGPIGGMPPPLEQVTHRDKPGPGDTLPAQGLVRALYEFQGRNPKELSIRKGDTLQVLDQQKKWWLVQDSQGQRGYVPSNILEPVGQGSRGGPDPSQLQDSPPNLLPESSPAEVTAWLKDKGFSRTTVRCLGVLTGQRLLQMRADELQAACPAEWRRVFFKLSPIRSSLGLGPQD